MQRKLAACAHDALEVHQLAPHIVLRDVRARRIGTQSNGNPLLQGLFCGGHDTVEDDAPVHHLDLSGMSHLGRQLDERQRRGDGAGQRAFAAHAVFTEQRQQLVVQNATMLDGVHARFQAHANTLGALDMRRGMHAQLMRLIHRCRRDLRRHAQHARLAFLLSVEHAAGDEQLHQIALVREAVAHDLTRLIRRFGNVCEQPRTVAARHRHAHARGDQARALVLARIDGVAHPHVSESRITHAAHRGDAA